MGSELPGPEMEVTRGWVEMALSWARANGDGQQVRLLQSWLEAQDDCVTNLRRAEKAERERDGLKRLALGEDRHDPLAMGRVQDSILQEATDEE